MVKLRTCIWSARFAASADRLFEDHPQLERVFCGLEWGITRFPEDFDDLGSQGSPAIRVALSDQFPGQDTPRVALFFLIKNPDEILYLDILEDTSEAPNGD